MKYIVKEQLKQIAFCIILIFGAYIFYNKGEALISHLLMYLTGFIFCLPINEKENQEQCK